VHLQQFLRQRLVPGRVVVQHTRRTVGEAQQDGRSIGTDGLGPDPLDTALNHERQQVEHVARLAEDTTAAHVGVQRPVALRQASRVHAVARVERRSPPHQLLAQREDGRREAPVEAHAHQTRPLDHGLDHGLEPGLGDRQRFLHETRFAGAQRGGDEFGVRIVPRQDRDRVHVVGVEHLLRAGRDTVETEMAAHRLGRHATGARHRLQRHRRVRLQRREEHRVGEVPSADGRHADLPRAPGRCCPARRRFGSRRLAGVRQDDAHEGFAGLAAHDLVGVLGALDRELVSQESREVDASLRHEVEHRSEVAALGPAHVGIGVVEPAVFVDRVVAARPVGGAHADVEFLGVEEPPVEFHPDRADDRDHAALAAQFSGQRQGRARLRRRADQDAVGAVAVGEPQDGRERIVAAAHDHVRTGLPRDLGAPRVEVHADDAHAGGLQELHRELAEQSESDDDRGLAEPQAGRAHAVHGNRPEGRHARHPRVHTVRHARAQVARNAEHLGMVRVARPGAGDPVARLDPGHAGRHLEHHSGRAVAERDVTGELAGHRAVGRQQPLAPELAERLLDQVRPRSRLAQQGFPRQLDHHALGSGRDQ